MAVSLEAFESRRHLDDVLALLEAEGWTVPSSDRSRAVRAFSAPGVTALVAVAAGRVVGFAHVLSDGEIVAYLNFLVVAAASRRRGIGRALVDEALHRSGALRLDVLAPPEADAFYHAFAHRAWTGYRLHTPSPQPTRALRQLLQRWFAGPEREALWPVP